LKNPELAETQKIWGSQRHERSLAVHNQPVGEAKDGTHNKFQRSVQEFNSALEKNWLDNKPMDQRYASLDVYDYSIKSETPDYDHSHTLIDYKK
jgi:hypothetical protein